ncbi:gliding motility lipoprotein GldH [Puia sp.]|uniref:gliding motility lipoprotein GldH n=1 Tax=Puia sp. TaxID=2045100 RepID=UPI002F4110AA
MKNFLVLLLAVTAFQWTACTRPDGMYEKDIPLPGQQWAGNFRPTFTFDISDKDTAYRYTVFIVIRHTDAYNYNNIWIRGSIRQPGDSVVRNDRYDLLLATNDKGWLGTGMEDIYEQRVVIQQSTKFSRPGEYSFALEQVMREDPLKHILNVGVRIERAP